MTVKMILATSEDGAIGLDNKLPWHCPEDLQYFKKVTENQCVVMGRKTFESFSFPKLPNRKNIVLSSSFVHQANKGLLDPFVVTYYTHLRHMTYIDNKITCDVFVIGGKSIYEQTLPFVSEIHHTVISGNYKADTYMDMSFLDNGEWGLTSSEELSEMATVNVWKRKED